MRYQYVQILPQKYQYSYLLPRLQTFFFERVWYVIIIMLLIYMLDAQLKLYYMPHYFCNQNYLLNELTTIKKADTVIVALKGKPAELLILFTLRDV